MNIKDYHFPHVRLLYGLFHFMASILLIAISAGCSTELPSAEEQEEWVPVKFTASIDELYVASSDTRATTKAIPSIVKTGFNSGDELKLKIYKADGITPVKEITIVKQADKNNPDDWKEKAADGTLVAFMFPLSYDRYKITAEYGTEMASGDSYSQKDYLKSTTAGTISVDNFSGSYASFKLILEHQYPCVELNLTSSREYASVQFIDNSGALMTFKLSFTNKKAGPYFLKLKDSSVKGVRLNGASSASSTNINFDTPLTFSSNYYLISIKTS